MIRTIRGGLRSATPGRRDEDLPRGAYIDEAFDPGSGTDMRADIRRLLAG